MIFYYSGCGNSRWVAREISSALNEKLSFIPDLQREDMKEYEIQEGESIGFVFPVYSWAAPKLVEDFVLNVNWKGNPGYVWFACTCGDEMGLTRRLFAKTLEKVGLKLDACFCFIMPETYLAFPGFHLDTKEKERAKIERAKSKLPSVIESICSKISVWDEHIGPLPRIKSYLIRPGFVKAVGDKKYKVNDDCIGCGKCAKVCPLQNISLVDVATSQGNAKRPTWNGNCTQCMACYQYCPKNAIHYGSFTKGKGQYHFPT